MNKNKILHIRLSEDELDDLNKKVKLSGLSKSTLVRILIKGYEPREKPDERFYEAIKELNAIGNNLNQLSYKANRLNFIDKDEYKKQAEQLAKFELKIEQEFLLPTKSKMRYKWWGTNN